MNNAIRTAVTGVLLVVQAAVARGEYTETMDPNRLTKNLRTDFSLVDDDAQSNQSDILQKAIDDVAAAGGGRLILPKGTYRFARILLKSNVHLLIEKDTVIKPYWPEGEKTENKFFEAPSIGAVKDYSGDHYNVIVENVTMEGFKYNADKPILTPEHARPGKWARALKEWKFGRGISDE